MDEPIALWTSLASPWGPVHVAATGRGVAAAELLTPSDAFVARLERRLRGRAARLDSMAAVAGPAPILLETAADQIVDLLAGGRPGFDLPLDLDDRPAWDRAILDAVREVPWGAMTSYGAIARRVGRPGAARAVGGAVGRNPVALIVPCHRVIAADGSLGGYGGDGWGSRDVRLAIKRALLATEGSFPSEPGR